MKTIDRPVERPGIPTFTLKLIMAVTGIIFVGFVFVHMIGNLKVYGGADSLNAYATWLREVGYPLVPHEGVLWVLRVVLLASVIGHVGASLTLWARGRRARGPHRRTRMKGLTAFGARTMLVGGILILAFVIVHVLDLTVGAVTAPQNYTPPAPDGTIQAYANLVASFSRPWMAAFYSAIMVVIALHILHGWRTVLQDVGVTGSRLRVAWVSLGAVIAVAVVLGNALIPVFVQLGVIS